MPLSGAINIFYLAGYVGDFIAYRCSLYAVKHDRLMTDDETTHLIQQMKPVDIIQPSLAKQLRCCSVLTLLAYKPAQASQKKNVACWRLHVGTGCKILYTKVYTYLASRPAPPELPPFNKSVVNIYTYEPVVQECAVEVLDGI
jgi:hypothetical protein